MFFIFTKNAFSNLLYSKIKLVFYTPKLFFSRQLIILPYETGV